MFESRAWPRVASGVLILVAGALLTACQRSTPPQAASAPAAAGPVAPPAASIDLVQLASTAVQACPESAAPTIPDGAKATTAQMVQAHMAFQAYDAATNNYTKCVDAAIERIATQYKGTVPAADIASLEAFGGRAHNTAIDQEQAVADQFNTQLRAYKTRHPGAKHPGA